MDSCCKPCTCAERLCIFILQITQGECGVCMYVCMHAYCMLLSSVIQQSDSRTVLFVVSIVIDINAITFVAVVVFVAVTTNMSLYFNYVIIVVII